MLHAQKNIECWLKGIVHPKISIITLAKFCRQERSVVYCLLYELCFIHFYTIDSFKQSSFVLVNVANQLQISEGKFLTTCKITIDCYWNYNIAHINLLKNGKCDCTSPAYAVPDWITFFSRRQNLFWRMSQRFLSMKVNGVPKVSSSKKNIKVV